MVQPNGDLHLEQVACTLRTLFSRKGCNFDGSLGPIVKRAVMTMTTLEQVGVISKRLGLSTRIILAVEEQPFEKVSFSKVEAAGFSEFQGVSCRLLAPHCS